MMIVVKSGLRGSCRLMLLAVALPFGESPAAGQASPGEKPEGAVPGQIFRVGGAVTPPVPTRRNDPEYSAEGRAAHMQGSVLVSIVVGSDGTPSHVRVVRSLGLGLDEAAIAAVEKWRFKPGMKGETPVATRATIEINFRVIWAPGEHWYVSGANFTYPPSAERPRVRTLNFGRLPLPSGPGSRYQVEFDIDTEGKTRNVSVTGIAPVDLDAFSAEVSKWKFEAARMGETPIAAHALLTLQSIDAHQ